METIRLSIARISFLLGTILGEGHAWGPYEQYDTHGVLSWGRKVGEIRSQGTCNMILFAAFQRFFLHFSYYFTPPPPPPEKKKKFAHGYF